MNYSPQIHFMQGKKWTEDEIKYLIEWVHKIGYEEMSFALGRTEKSISAKVSELCKQGLMQKTVNRNQKIFKKELVAGKHN